MRTERDSLGQKDIPDDAYYGIQSARAAENFPITGTPVHRELYIALAYIKKAAAMANLDVKLLKEPAGSAIIAAADEIIAGQHTAHFIVDSIQGGAGTSINMNMNEVIANRALELLGKRKGDYGSLSPNNHVNMSQSTNDVIPSALKIAAYLLAQQLLATKRRLAEELRKKQVQFHDIIKVARTHLQDAVPVRLGQQFGAYSRVIERDIRRLEQATSDLLWLNMGATAVGTGLNAKPEYIDSVILHLRELLGIEVKRADDLVDATQNTDAYTELSSALKISAVNLSKICNDIRLMASGPITGLNELLLPPRQPGSSIMPGKVNPVMAEVVNQVAFQVLGNDHTIALACEAGQLELNVMGPVIAFNLLQSLKIMNNGIDVFTRFALEGLEANRTRLTANLEKSFSMITALNPHLGYEVAAGLVKDALKTGMTLREIILERGLLTQEELDVILHPEEMTTPGIAGERFLNEDRA
ncbi:aspartate ammonia-lyase [Paenibacillus protaetiae]|uniref:aspartate ammonia-lyase n=1 Tax=Paenibacillus protaetiae TaxID=2509456 RepID=A0A4P6EWQ0_9BACL|nr:aspartate ammonia-lyase [Paenibacillus protaetiae]QAY67156.1 aspartate ammonia-lyase [Paenibacillus protaetiae]